jgi:hypothetical protein
MTRNRDDELMVGAADHYVLHFDLFIQCPFCDDLLLYQ